MINVLILFIFILANKSFASTNLIGNNDFEQRLTNWKYNTAVTATNPSNTGTYAARIGYNNTSLNQIISNNITSNKNYSFSFYGKLGKASAKAIVKVNFLDNSKNKISSLNINVSSTNTNYNLYSKNFTTPNGTTFIQIVAQKLSGAVTYVYFDDFSLTEIAPAPLPPSPPSSPIQNTYIPLGIGGGGAMSAMSISPYANLWFVGTDMGTLFRSIDNGKSFLPINHNQVLFASDLSKAVSLGFSSDGTTIYHASAGSSPQISYDSGITFSKISSLSLEPDEYIKYWISNSLNHDFILAATNKGIYKSTNKASTWSKSSLGEESIGTFIDLNSSTKRIYHATPSKILISDDGGVTYYNYLTMTDKKIRQFTGGSDNNGTLLAFGDNDGINACSWAAKFRNSWGENSYDNTVNNCGFLWTSLNGSAFSRKNVEIGDHLKMAENDSSTIYITGSKKWLQGYGTKVSVSKDRGNSFLLKLHQLNWDVIPYSPWPPSKLEYSAVALDIGWWDSGYESFTVNQRNSNMAAGTGYFFLHVTENAGDNWKAPFTKYKGTQSIPTLKDQWNSTGLEVTSVYKLKFHPNNSNLMYVAMADLGGIISENHGGSFRLTGADYNSIYDYSFDLTNENIVYAAEGALHDFPNEWHSNFYDGEGGIFRSSDKGRNWSRITPASGELNRQYLSVAYNNKNNTIYAGTQKVGIIKSTDGGLSWSYFNTGLPSSEKIIPQLEIDPITGNVYALLTGNAPNFSNQSVTGIYFLDIANGATSWKLLRTNVIPQAGANNSQVWYYPTSFAIDYKNPGTMYLTDYENNGNWLMTGVWKTTDNGKTWNRLKQVTHPTEIKIDPSDSNKIYIASYYEMTGQWGEGGQLFSKDGGITWNKNLIPSYQKNARGVSLDPQDTTKIFYTYFGSGMLYGPNPNQ